MDMLINPSTSNAQARSTEFRANAAQLEGLWAQLLAKDVDVALQTALKARFDAYMSKGLAPANLAMAEGRYDDAAELYLLHISPLAPEVQQQMDALISAATDSARAEYESTQRISQTIQWALGGMAILALAVGGDCPWQAGLVDAYRTAGRPAAANGRVDG